MKRLPKLPKWLILAVVIILCLVFAKVAFPARLPREVTRAIKFLAQADYDSFSLFCADTVLFGLAFTDNCLKMERKELVRFLKENGLCQENRNLFKRFPKGFNWDRDEEEIICYRFSKPPACLIFGKEKEVWKLEVLGVYFPEEEGK